MGAVLAAAGVAGATGAATLGIIHMTGSKNKITQSQIINSSMSETTQYILTNQSNVVVTPFQEQSFTLNILQGATVTCKNFTVMQTSTSTTYIDVSQSDSFSADMSQQIQQQVTQSLSAQQKNIDDFLSSPFAKKANISKQNIEDMFSNAITDTFTEQNLSIIEASTVQESNLSINVAGAITASDACTFDQNSVMYIYVSNTMQLLMNNILSVSENQTILAQFYAWQMNQGSGLASIIIVIVAVIIFLIIIAVIWHLWSNHKKAQEGDD